MIFLFKSPKFPLKTKKKLTKEQTWVHIQKKTKEKENK